MIVTARFTEPEEFAAELRLEHARNATAIERQIVRVTKLGRPGGPNGVLTTVTVQAGALVQGRLVLLEHFVGQLWDGPDDGAVQQRAQQVVDELTAELHDVGLDVRAGLFEARELRELLTSRMVDEPPVPS